LSYNKTYGNTKNVFGSEPEKILVDFTDKIEKSKPILDIGAGQGRNSFFLTEEGFEVDAIDPSSVAVDTINKISSEKNYSVSAFHIDFQNYYTEKIYSAILAFGLIQILDWSSISSLIDKIESRIIKDSLVFITAFSVKDYSYQKYSTQWKAAGRNSFSYGNLEFRTFLEENEILTLFDDFSVLHHWEGLGKKHKHGDGPIEQHSMVEVVLQKK
jgi:tellurite methyltransferase